jgi:hypothetical protein
LPERRKIDVFVLNWQAKVLTCAGHASLWPICRRLPKNPADFMGLCLILYDFILRRQRTCGGAATAAYFDRAGAAGGFE